MVRSIKHKYKRVGPSSAPVPAVVVLHHVNRRALGSQPTLSLPQTALAFAVVTEATRDDFEQYFAGLSHEGDAMKIATLSLVFFL